MEENEQEEKKSAYNCPSFFFDWDKTLPHPDPEVERLRLYTIPDTDYSYCLNIADWKDYKGFVGWVPPDSLVPITNDAFGFLATESLYNEHSIKDKQGVYARVKAKRLRGVVSYGLLVRSPFITEVFEDVSELLGVKHYQPVPETAKQAKGPSADSVPAPEGVYYKYDIENFLKYGRKMFVEGEPVNITVKFHGEAWRAVYKNGKQYVGSRTQWKSEFTNPPQISVEELVSKGVEPEKAQAIYDAKVTNFVPSQSHWWKGLSPNVRKFCEENEGYCVYSEIINTQGKGFGYNLKPGEFKTLAYDILKPDGTWMDVKDFQDTCSKYGIEIVKIIHDDYPLFFEEVKKIASEYKLEGTPVNEGIVIKPMKVRYVRDTGRVFAKLINPEYLEK